MTDIPRSSRRSAATLAVLGAATLLLGGCRIAQQRAGDDARGRGHEVAALSADERAAAYVVALHGAFDLGPDMNLLVVPAELPREGGYDAAAPLPSEVVAALRGTGVVQGSCEPVRTRTKVAPWCRTARPGYAVRLSDVFRLPGDTVQLYLAAEQVRAARDSAAYLPAFGFEERYTMVRAGREWTVVRKERKQIG